jgi:hypothetical protein
MAKALRNKLYYPVDIFIAPASSSFVAVVPFIGGTGPGFGTDIVTDRYNNVMAPNLFDGVTAATDPSGQRRTRQAIGAWFHCSSGVALNLPDFPAALPIKVPVCVDFISQTAPIVGSAPAIDPATQRRARARLRAFNPAFGAGGSGVRIHGTLYIQRQHSAEV